MLWKAFLSVQAMKLLLIPAYKSTDFEVHRNWMALTYSLPLEKWYTDTTSEWTLDYPPLFAWFEYLLAQVAYFFDKDMLVLTNLNYSSSQTVLFMRLSVIFSDILLALGCRETAEYLQKNPLKKCSKWKSAWNSPVSIFFMLVLTNMGLILVDHIHFQYNGILFGILLISIGNILKGNYAWGTFWFAVLLNMKHIYLYMAPAFGVYVLRNYCLTENGNSFELRPTVKRIVRLASIALFVTGLSFGPFILKGQLQQVLSRLFPFKRGLCHTYWAPNFWALYNFGDKALLELSRFSSRFENSNVILQFIGKLIAIAVPVAPKDIMKSGSMTSGVLQNYEHSVLPLVTPLATAFIVFISIMPCLVKLWMSPGNPLHFLRSVVICTSCAFLFGWHVHEKAVIMIIIPLSLMAVVKRKEAETYILVALTGHYSLLPLIFTPHENLLKVLLFLLSSWLTASSLSQLFTGRSRGICPTLTLGENTYLSGLPILFLYEHLFHRLLGLHLRFPFLPLLLTSVYCALGVTYATIKYYAHFLTMFGTEHKQKTF